MCSAHCTQYYLCIYIYVYIGSAGFLSTFITLIDFVTSKGIERNPSYAPPPPRPPRTRGAVVRTHTRVHARTAYKGVELD